MDSMGIFVEDSGCGPNFTPPKTPSALDFLCFGWWYRWSTKPCWYIYIYIIYIYKKQTSVFRFATFQTNSWVQTAHNFTAGTARNLQPERPMVVSRVNFLSDVWWRQPIRSNPVDQLRLVGFFSHDLNTKSTDAELAITKFQAAGSFFESPCFTWTRCLPYRKSRIIWWKNQVSIGFLPKKKAQKL